MLLLYIFVDFHCTLCFIICFSALNIFKYSNMQKYQASLHFFIFCELGAEIY